jgi:hypothetical protein
MTVPPFPHDVMPVLVVEVFPVQSKAGTGPLRSVRYDLFGWPGGAPIGEAPYVTPAGAHEKGAAR